MIEHEFEPVPGLPEDLPPGEYIIWQGAPQWRVLAQRAFHLKTICAYFVLLLMLRLGTGLVYEGDLSAAVQPSVVLTSLGLSAMGLLVLYAWLIARSTMYTLTNKRLVMRFGIALPMSVNLPFSRIQSAAVKSHAEGYGDIPLTVEGDVRISYIVMWPHTRPWKFRHPQPMLRCIPDAKSVSNLLARAASGAVDDIRRAGSNAESGSDADGRQASTSTWGETT